jgi:chromosomal replication initiation ATPase DnaA
LEKAYKKQEFIDFFNQLSDTDKNMILSSSRSYIELAKKYPNLPKSYL